MCRSRSIYSRTSYLPLDPLGSTPVSVRQTGYSVASRDFVLLKDYVPFDGMRRVGGIYEYSRSCINGKGVGLIVEYEDL